MMSLVTEFQVSAVAFSILMDYFSSVPVTKKNLVTEQTQLLVISMTFCVCTQVTRNFVCLLAPHRVTLIVALPLILTSLGIRRGVRSDVKLSCTQPDFRSALRVVKLVLNTQCYQQLWLTM